MMRTVVNLFCIGLAFHASLFAADRPVWTLDTRALGVRETWLRDSTPKATYTRVRLQFSSADELMISFLQRQTPKALVQTDIPANSSVILVLFLVAKADGRIIRRSNWPVIGEEDWATQMDRGSRLQPLASGGYVGIVSGHLLVMDSSFKVLYDRGLGRLRQGCVFELVTPLSGSFFVLAQQCAEYKDSAEVIDSKFFATAEQLDIPGLRVEDVWGDHLLAARETEHTSNTRAAVEAEPIRYIVQEKQIGGSWLDTGLTVNGYIRPLFTNDGAIVMARYLARGSTFCDCWSLIDRWTKAGPAVCYANDESIVNFIPARQSPLIAVAMGKTTGLRAALDMNGLGFAVVHNLETRQELLTTQARKDVVGYAFSSDGRYLAVLTKKRLEMYMVANNDATDNK